ncbi:MAG: alpha/beta hydrolase [Lachnospiraceae bacterium]|nr:alpha/beta hydrolase [Lachnospiraceae bacterium]
MERKTSIRGRTARKMVRLANHFPLFGNKAQNGEIRMKLSEREKIWECPAHLQLEVIGMENFRMELLKKRDNRNGLPDNASGGVESAGGIILQLHGGGYYGKLHNTYRDMAGLYNEISNGMDVLSIDYRVAPEYPFPAALEDAVAAYQWVLDQGYNTEKLFVAGDSAGGGLALSLCLYLRNHGLKLPAGIITMSAWTDLTKSGESYEENFDIDPIFGGTKDSLVYKEGYYKGENPENPYISPINGDFSGFPPMLMQVGEYEMLLSDTLEVVKKAREKGVLVKEHVYGGMFHVFQMGLLLYPEAKEAWVEAGRFIRKLSKERRTAQ